MDHNYTISILEREIQKTIKKLNTKTIDRDLNKTVDSLISDLGNKGSTVVLTKKKKPDVVWL